MSQAERPKMALIPQAEIDGFTQRNRYPEGEITFLKQRTADSEALARAATNARASASWESKARKLAGLVTSGSVEAANRFAVDILEGAT